MVCGENSEVEEEPSVEEALSSGALSPGDVCYRRVSRMSRVLRALARAPPPAHDARAAAAHAVATLNILTVSLTTLSPLKSNSFVEIYYNSPLNLNRAIPLLSCQ